MVSTYSEAFSLKGFDIKKWLFDDFRVLLEENMEVVKILVGAGISIAVLYPESAALVAFLGGATIVTSRILAAIEFFVKKVRV